VNIRELWLKTTSTRYLGALEAEVMRLRAENRALLNSILGIAGVPPVTVPGQDSGAQPAVSQIATAENGNAKAAAYSADTSGPRGVPVAVPMRRRSWQQITRMLEFESARKNEKADGGEVSLAVARRQ
jgi:hypothetical protein